MQGDDRAQVETSGKTLKAQGGAENRLGMKPFPVDGREGVAAPQSPDREG